MTDTRLFELKLKIFDLYVARRLLDIKGHLMLTSFSSSPSITSVSHLLHSTASSYHSNQLKMQFTTIFVVTMAALSNALAIDQSSAETQVERSFTKRAITCVPKDGKYGHEAELTQCVNDMRNNRNYSPFSRLQLGLIDLAI